MAALRTQTRGTPNKSAVASVRRVKKTPLSNLCGVLALIPAEQAAAVLRLAHERRTSRTPVGSRSPLQEGC